VDKARRTSYKGFDIYPLVYRFDPARKWYEHTRRLARTYSSSVLICQEGDDPTREPVGVFKVQGNAFDCVAVAMDAAVTTARDIIDRMVDKKVVVGL
jgi:hypothetical protein